MTKKEFGRFIAFILVVCVVLYVMCDLFEQENTSNIDRRFATYRNLNENTVDAVWIGTSGVDRYWIPPKAYEEHGFTLYPLASDGMPAWLYIDMIKEAYAYQNPQLIIVDIRPFGQSDAYSETADVRVRRILDAMDPLSVNRLNTAFTAMRVIHEHYEGKRFDLSYLLSYIRYHSMWQNEDYYISIHRGSKEHNYLGFYMQSSKSLQATELDKVITDPNHYEELDALAIASFYDLLDYSRANNIELLFVDTPQYRGTTEMSRTNSFLKLLDEEGLNYISFNETDADGNFIHAPSLDPKTDFYNDGHTNYYGAEKFTEAFSAYLMEHYDLPDHREDAAVQEDWDGVYDRIKEKIATWENEEITEE